jgi:hypothetical protein
MASMVHQSTCLVAAYADTSPLGEQIRIFHAGGSPGWRPSTDLQHPSSDPFPTLQVSKISLHYLHGLERAAL